MFDLFDFDPFEGSVTEDEIERFEDNLSAYDSYIETLKKDLSDPANSTSEKESIQQRLDLLLKQKRKDTLKLEKMKERYEKMKSFREREIQELYGPDYVSRCNYRKYVRLYIETDDLIYKYFLYDNKSVYFGKNKDNYLEWFGETRMIKFSFENPDLYIHNLLPEEIVTLNGSVLEPKQKTKINKGDIVRFENQNLTLTITDLQFDEDKEDNEYLKFI